MLGQNGPYIKEVYGSKPDVMPASNLRVVGLVSLYHSADT